jgi:D-glycero-D-manno-heptose 1,7-bisphosphate phosphatase
MPIRAVFLDREGVLTPKLAKGEYLLQPEQAVLAPDVASSLRSLQDCGCVFFAVSNQSCVRRGLITMEAATALHQIVVDKLQEEGVRIVDSLLCPHVDEDDCACRKPKPGMILDLCATHGVDPKTSAMIGDSWTDMQAAEAAKCGKRILLADAPVDATVATFPSLATAARWMISSGLV